MKQVRLAINGMTVIADEGTSILKAARDNGIRIPTLCHHPHLEPAGACRVCMVEDEKSTRMMASCVTPVASGMNLRTDSEEIRRHRTNIVRLLLANHPDSCIVCNKGNRCELRLLAAELGIGATGLHPMPHSVRIEEANPFIIRDLTKCILCGKCIRADHELVAVGAIDYNHRGFRSRPATAHELPLEESTCTFCGTCVSMCPTGALTVKNAHYAGSPQKESPTVCGFCAVGCSLVIGSANAVVVDVNPSRSDASVNRSTLCVRGHFAHDFLNAAERLGTPLIRKESGPANATWDEALGLVAERLLSIKAEYGPQSIAFLGSSKCTNEENYLFQKIARVVLGTNNVDSGTAPSGRAVWQRLEERLGSGIRIRPLSDLEKAEAILVLGAEPARSAPVLGYHLRRASRIGGIPVVVANPRKTDLLSFSDLWLPVNPNSDTEMIHALAAILLRKGAHDREFVGKSVEGFEEYRDSLASLDLGKASLLTGLEVKTLEEAATLIAGRKVAFIIGHGISLQGHGIRVVDGMVNLAFLTGSTEAREGGFYWIPRDNNEVGAWDMGCVPDALPGRQPLWDGGARRQWERAWHASLSPDAGLGMARMVREAENRNLKALYVMGENPLRALPGCSRISAALGNLEFLVVQDILQTETTRLAHVVLPGAAFSEKGGSFTNMEGRIQSFEPAVPLQGEARPDWEILGLLGQKMGFRQSYRSVQDIRYEIARLVPGYGDLSRSHGGAAWVRDTNHSAPPFLSPYSPIPTEARDENYPYQAVLGSPPGHLGSGTRTSFSARILEYAIDGEVEISPESAASLGIRGGDVVSIASAYGAIQRKVVLTGAIKPGLVYVPRAVHSNNALRLLPFAVSVDGDGPGINVVPVRVERGTHGT